MRPPRDARALAGALAAWVGLVGALSAAAALLPPGEAQALAVAVAYLAAPVARLVLDPEGARALGLSLERPGTSLAAFGLAAVVSLSLAHAAWLAMHPGGFHPGVLPDWPRRAAFQLLQVSALEEVYYRGWLEERLGRAFDRRWLVLGAEVGPGWILTAALFALSHAVLDRDPGRLDTFFPGLAFGYLRARTGSLLAPVLFHAACNLWLEWVVVCTP